MEKQPYTFLVWIGMCLQDLRRAQAVHYSHVNESYHHLMEALKKLGLSAAQRQAALLDRHFKFESEVTKDIAGNIARGGDAIWTALDESKGKSFLLEVDQSVSPELYALPQRRTLTPAQVHLHEETIRCLERQAYRAGIVMGWALAYDVIRWSIWDGGERIEKLKQNWRGRSNLKTDDYEAFVDSTTSEREFLENCRDADLLGEKPGQMFDKLAGYLRTRNEYAHANPKTPTISIANGYIDHLMQTIAEKPFSPTVPISKIE